MSDVSESVAATVLPLDPSLLHLTNAEKNFLRASIAEDEEQIRNKIIEIQRWYVIISN
jgi:hypothetical protein